METVLIVVHLMIVVALVGVVLLQRSEGGGLGIGGGGSPGGLMSARGAADFLTRATKWSAVLFVALAIILAALAVNASGGREIDQTLDRSVSTESADAVVPAAEGEGAAAPADTDPLADVAE